MTIATPVIHSDPDILGGTPVFMGTRVPVKTLLDYLESGDRIDEFLDHFPSVRREQAICLQQRWRYRRRRISSIALCGEWRSR